MSDIFIAHVEEDHDIAFEVALQLEQAGYNIWIDDLDTSFGENYMTEIVSAIGACQALVLIISPDSLGSSQVNSEVEKAFENGLKFITILRGITDAEYKRRKPNWDYMFGRRVSAPLPPEGVAGIIDRVIKGLKSFGIQPRKPDAARIGRLRKALDETRAHPTPREDKKARAEAVKEIKPVKSKKPLIITIVSVIVSAILLVVFLPRLGGNGKEAPELSPTAASTKPGATTGTSAPPATTPTTTSPSTTKPATSPATTSAQVLKPDLVIQDITWSPKSPSMGNDVTFTIAITNRGRDKAAASHVAYYIDGAFKDTISVNQIDSGATAKVSFKWKAELGTHKIKAVADFNDSVAEGDETNNEKEINFSEALDVDLLITDITWSPESPSYWGNVYFTATVMNRGNGIAGNFYVKFYCDGWYKGDFYIDVLYAGQATTALYTWSRAESGTYIFKAVADGENSVAESDETNNAKAVTFSIKIK